MKSRSFTTALLTTIALVLLLVGTLSVAAQDSTTAVNKPNSVETVGSTPANPVQPPDGARDVLNLSAAKVSEDTIVSFIENSAASYGLKAAEVLYLRDHGVSDRVINAMLNHRPEIAEARARIAARARAEAEAKTSDDSTRETDSKSCPARPKRVPTRISTVCAAPSPLPVYYDWYNCFDCYPYYRAYYRYPYPGWSFSFGWGGGYWGGGYHHHRSVSLGGGRR